MRRGVYTQPPYVPRSRERERRLAGRREENCVPQKKVSIHGAWTYTRVYTYNVLLVYYLVWCTRGIILNWCCLFLEHLRIAGERERRGGRPPHPSTSERPGPFFPTTNEPQGRYNSAATLDDTRPTTARPFRYIRCRRRRPFATIGTARQRVLRRDARKSDDAGDNANAEFSCVNRGAAAINPEDAVPIAAAATAAAAAAATASASATGKAGATKTAAKAKATTVSTVAVESGVGLHVDARASLGRRSGGVSRHQGEDVNNDNNTASTTTNNNTNIDRSGNQHQQHQGQYRHRHRNQQH